MAVVQRQRKQETGARSPASEFGQLRMCNRSIKINGKRYTGTVREGASANQVIEAIARQNGGGVAKKHYQDMGADEIVALKIGSEWLVKGDSKCVAGADFSGFDDPASSMKEAARQAEKSDGGIHFFIGENNIPMQVSKSGDLVFPNADELIIGPEGMLPDNSDSFDFEINIRLVTYNADPKKIGDLESKQGGARINGLDTGRIFSNLDSDKIEQAHGGGRFEKVMVPDNEVLLFDIESGELRGARELAGSMMRAQSFGFEPGQMDVIGSLQMTANFGIQQDVMQGGYQQVLVRGSVEMADIQVRTPMTVITGYELKKEKPRIINVERQDPMPEEARPEITKKKVDDAFNKPRPKDTTLRQGQFRLQRIPVAKPIRARQFKARSPLTSGINAPAPAQVFKPTTIIKTQLIKKSRPKDPKINPPPKRPAKALPLDTSKRIVIKKEAGEQKEKPAKNPRKKARTKKVKNKKPAKKLANPTKTKKTAKKTAKASLKKTKKKAQKKLKNAKEEGKGARGKDALPKKEKPARKPANTPAKGKPRAKSKKPEVKKDRKKTSKKRSANLKKERVAKKKTPKRGKKKSSKIKKTSKKTSKKVRKRSAVKSLRRMLLRSRS